MLNVATCFVFVCEQLKHLWVDGHSPCSSARKANDITAAAHYLLVLSCKLVSLQCQCDLQFLPILGFYDKEASLLYELCEVSTVSAARVDYLVAVGPRDQQLSLAVPRL